MNCNMRKTMQQKCIERERDLMVTRSRGREGEGERGERERGRREGREGERGREGEEKRGLFFF